MKEVTFDEWDSGKVKLIERSEKIKYEKILY